MAFGCGAKCAKVLLIVFNFVFWLSGAAILGIGIWMKVDPNITKYLDIVVPATDDPYIEYASYLLIGVGCLIFIVGFFGCCGAIKESKCMLGMYMFFMVLVLGGEVAAGALVAIYKGKITKELKGAMVKQNQMKYSVNDTVLTKAWDYMQIELQCCGTNNLQDYENSVYVKENEAASTGISLPASCCKLKEGSTTSDPKPLNADKCQKSPRDDQFVNTKGCYEGMMQWFNKHSLILIIVGCGLAAIEILGFLLACCLCRNIGEEA